MASDSSGVSSDDGHFGLGGWASGFGDPGGSTKRNIHVLAPFKPLAS